MKVLVLGSSGMIGTAVSAELIVRGHEVIAGVRSNSTSEHPRSVVVDVRDEATLVRAAVETDAIMSCIGGAGRGDHDVVVDAVAPLLTAAKQTRSGRLLVVGGAGSLFDGPKQRLDASDFDPGSRPSALAQKAALEALRERGDAVDWVYLSPSDVIGPGPATGAVVLGEDTLLRGRDGESFVTTGDFAVAFVDELEHPRHHRERFTVRTLR
ncbi:NAD(P)H-binding protein [Microbacterium sp. A8/3-1]|uniref:NAD(P)H-binding protein n=1 Tax=Microbacterium sp. A8/3-1 TaxID=3160749 RepID=A0AAU7VW10_9MICO